MGGVYFGVNFSENEVNFPLIYVMKFQRLNLSCCISQNTFTYCICNKCTSWCNLNFLKCFHGYPIFQRKSRALFHILRLLSNNNLYFAWSCILHILTQDSSLHACAKFHYCTLAYVRDINQLSVILTDPRMLTLYLRVVPLNFAKSADPYQAALVRPGSTVFAYENIVRYNRTLVGLTNKLFALCTNMKVYLYNYS